MSATSVLVTGSEGFLGKHLMEALGRRAQVQASGYDVGNSPQELTRALATADIVYHLAGVNRPQDPGEFQRGNAGLTRSLCASLRALKRRPTVVLASSIQAELDNPYGTSKREAERALRIWSEQTGGPAVIFRLKNIFGKWCRPNYNSVVATFCHNIARGLPISISDPKKTIDLVFIDDVVAGFLQVLEQSEAGCCYREIRRSFKIGLGELAALIRSFRQSRQSLRLPSLEDDFTRCLYGTYLSYLPVGELAYRLETRTDNRGCLAEFIKSPGAGQLFISRTKPGVTRGDHYHHTKAEKFLVLEGEAVIRLRAVPGPPAGVVEYRVCGSDFRVVDIPPGYTHSLENVGGTELVVLFWASEIFDPARPDTVALAVVGERSPVATEAGTAMAGR